MKGPILVWSALIFMGEAAMKGGFLVSFEGRARKLSILSEPELVTS